jgi:hypothetical protein
VGVMTREAEVGPTARASLTPTLTPRPAGPTELYVHVVCCYDVPSFGPSSASSRRRHDAARAAFCVL